MHRVEVSVDVDPDGGTAFAGSCRDCSWTGWVRARQQDAAEDAGHHAAETIELTYSP